jgi:hypothetical protein
LASSGRGEDLLAVVNHHLAKPLGENTFGAVADGAAVFFHEDAVSVLLWLSRGDGEERAARIDEAALSPEGAALASRLAALYGSQIREAFYRWYASTHPDDWYAVIPRITQDPTSGHYSMQLLIRKLNGEVIAVGGRPNSLLRLALNIAEMLNVVEDPTQFDQRSLGKLVSAIDNLRAALAAAESETVEPDE